MRLNHILSQITTTKIFVIDCNWSQRIPQVRLLYTVKHSWGKTFAVGMENKMFQRMRLMECSSTKCLCT